MRRKLTHAHFGHGVDYCPMSGKRAPELAAGRLANVMEEAWRDFEWDALRGPDGQPWNIGLEQEALLRAEM